MNCEELRTLLAGYLDGELDLVRNLEIERHLEGCAACTEELNRQQALRQALGEAALYHQAPVELRQRIRSSLRRTRKPRPALRPPTWRVLAVAASLAFVALLAWGIFRVWFLPPAEEVQAQQVVAGHIRSLMASHLLDVESTDQHKVKPWFSGKVNFAPEVKNPKEEGYPLLGGRLDYVDNHEAAALVYSRHGHFINVFIWPATSETNEPARALTRQGYHLIHWTSANLNYWVISDLNEEELRRFADLIRQ